MGKKKRRNTLAITGLIFCLLCGCSPLKLQKDPSFARWKEFAKKHIGTSPKTSISTVDIERGLKIRPVKKREKTSPLLPKVPVTLKIRDGSVKAILHALAKAASVNIITTENIKGRVDMDVIKEPWDKVFKSLLKSQGLTYEFDGKIIRVISKEDLNAELAIEELKVKKEEYEQAKIQTSPLDTKVVKINFTDAKKLQKVLSELLTKDKNGKKRGNIVVDEHTNSLVISAVPEDIEKIVNLIKVLDKPTDQIHLKAYIVEANRNVARDLGIQWGGRWINSINGGKNSVQLSGPVASGTSTGGTGTTTTGGTSTSSRGGEYAFGTGSSNTGFGVQFPINSVLQPSASSTGGGLNILIGDLEENILEMQLSALEEKGQVHILSSPSLTTLDNQMAFTESGQKVPYVTVDEDGNREVKFEDAVLRLEVTPHVIADKYLKMDIKVKKDEVDFSKTVDGNPTINKKQTQTSLVVPDGDTIVISGLSKQTLRDAVSGVPVLKNLPILGNLFKGDSKSKEFEEILIFITPTILKSRDELQRDFEKYDIKPDELEKLSSPTGDRKAEKWLKKSDKFAKDKKWDDVIRCSLLAMDLDPGEKKTYFYTSLGYYNKQRYEKALFYINRALVIDSNYMDALNLKGEILEKMGYTKKAMEFYKKGCGLDSKDACKNYERLFKFLEK